jgi:GntR family transcriptional regulator
MKIKPNVPIAVQASNVLRKLLREEHFAGNRLPGEHVIAADLGVSRGTVRQALTILEQEGVITRHQGSGTFVNPHVLQINARVDTAYEFSELIGAAGYTPAIDTVEVSRQPATVDVARRLEIAENAPMLTVSKVFLADEQPAIYVLEHIPEALIQEPFAESELYQPIFHFLDQRCHAQVDYILSEIIPCRVEGDLVTRLGVDEGQPVIQFSEVFYSLSNQPLLAATVYFRDPVIRFHALRKLHRA